MRTATGRPEDLAVRPRRLHEEPHERRRRPRPHRQEATRRSRDAALCAEPRAPVPRRGASGGVTSMIATSITPLEQAASSGSSRVTAGGEPDQPESLDLVGRKSECGVLDELLDAVRNGRSEVLVVRGDAGIGKTALLDYLCRRASGCTVNGVVAVSTEQDLDYAGLDQLCRPFIHLVDH